jgi:hypothetical protein
MSSSWRSHFEKPAVDVAGCVHGTYQAVYTERIKCNEVQNFAHHKSGCASPSCGLRPTAGARLQVSPRASLACLPSASHSSPAAGPLTSSPQSASMEHSTSVRWLTPVAGHACMYASTGGHSSMSSHNLPCRQSDATSVPSDGDSASGRSPQYSRFFGRWRLSGQPLPRTPTPTALPRVGLSRQSGVSAAGGSGGSTACGKAASSRSERVVSPAHSPLSGGRSTTAQARRGGTTSSSAHTIGAPSLPGGAGIAEDQCAAVAEEGAHSGKMGCVALLSARRSRARTTPREAATRAVDGEPPHLLKLPSPASWARSFGTLMQRRRSSVSRLSVDLAKVTPRRPGAHGRH